MRGADVLPAIAAAASRAGVDFSALYNTARLESGFDPGARAKTSSATGLFQFIDATWLRMVDRHGAALGLQGLSRADALVLRRDPVVASELAARHMAENAQALEGALGRAATQTDLYLAHFLGLGGATRFLRGLAARPEQAGEALLPAAARANPAIFRGPGGARSLSEIHALLEARLQGGGQAAGALAGGGSALAALPSRVPLGVAVPGLGAADRAGGDAAAAGGSMQAAAAARLAYLLIADLGAS